MLQKIRIHSKKLLHRRKLRSRFYLKNNNARGLCRLSVHKTAKNMYAQVIDDSKGITLAASCSLLKNFKKGTTCNMEVAKLVGADIAKKAVAAGITEVIFDRGGRAYHGKIKVLAESARAAGLKL